MTKMILSGEGLFRHFLLKDGRAKRRKLTAVDDVSFSVREGETFAVVGESGSGKTTLAMLMTRLLDPDGGTVCFEGRDVFSLDRKELLAFRRSVQMIFQDPFASLDPRMRVGSIIAEGMRIHRLCTRAQRARCVGALLEQVGLSPDAANKFPHEFSGGQRQRIGIARALAVEPRLIVADEPVSALDVSVQGKVLNLLMRLKSTRHLTFVIIAHDLRMVGQTADTVAVMYLGSILELAPARDLFSEPLHPYTKLLLASVPVIQRRPPVVSAAVTANDKPRVGGCKFRERCAEALPLCETAKPQLKDVGGGRLVACHLY